MTETLKQKALDDWAKNQGDYEDWMDFCCDNEGHLTDDQATDLVAFTLRVVFDFCETKEKEVEDSKKELQKQYPKAKINFDFEFGKLEAFKTIKEKCE